MNISDGGFLRSEYMTSARLEPPSGESNAAPSTSMSALQQRHDSATARPALLRQAEVRVDERGRKGKKKRVEWGRRRLFGFMRVWNFNSCRIPDSVFIKIANHCLY